MNKREFIKTLMGMAFWGAKQGTWARGWDDAISDAIAIAEELDEPETLSEEWIENHTASADTISYYSEENVPVVTVEKLKNLLVPKQDNGFVVFEKDKLDEEVQTMKKGERIMQGIVVDYKVSENDISTSVRSGGFGSTGV